jgi:hypothetical protein
VPEPTLAQAKSMVASGKLRFFVLDGGGGMFGGMMGRGGGTSTVSAITSWVQKSCTKVPAASYGASTDMSLYQCARS